MSCRKRLTALAVASVIGGLFFTVLSGLYVANLPMTDSEVVYFGFPFPWLRAWRSAWKGQTSWVYGFQWSRFIVDSAVYGLLVAATLGMYFISLSKKDRPSSESANNHPNRAGSSKMMLTCLTLLSYRATLKKSW